MVSRPLKAAFALTIGFALLIAVITAQSADDSDLRRFLLPPEDCPIPCWQGIRPGVTHWDEADQILERNSWVDIIRFYPGMAPNSALVTWTWSASHPAEIN